MIPARLQFFFQIGKGSGKVNFSSQNGRVFDPQLFFSGGKSAVCGQTHLGGEGDSAGNTAGKAQQPRLGTQGNGCSRNGLPDKGECSGKGHIAPPAAVNEAVGAAYKEFAGKQFPFQFAEGFRQPGFQIKASAGECAHTIWFKNQFSGRLVGVVQVMSFQAAAVSAKVAVSGFCGLFPFGTLNISPNFLQVPGSILALPVLCPVSASVFCADVRRNDHQICWNGYGSSAAVVLGAYRG